MAEGFAREFGSGAILAVAGMYFAITNNLK